MSPLFSDLLKQREYALHYRSVWEEVRAHLAKFVDTDSVQATSGIQTKGGGLVVPQVVISDALADVEMKLVEVELVITGIDSKTVEDTRGKKEPARKEEGATGGKGGKRGKAGRTVRAQKEVLGD
jgi:hypothetical protein